MKCPRCATDVTHEPYDIGSGPELNCPTCDHCFGAEGQALKPLDIDAIRAEVAKDLPEGHWLREEPTVKLIL